MRLLKTFLQSIVVLLSTMLLLLSCTVSTTKTKDPVFTVSPDSISLSLKSLIVAKEVNLSGTETKTNGKITSELTVRLINSINAPEDETQRTEIGKQVAKLLKQALKNPGDYTTYKVLFVTQETDGAVTRSSYTGHIYKSDDL
jgi:hypothetical protein